MPDYSQGKIYKLVCKTTNKIYIGSTTETLKRRLGQHQCKRDTKAKEIIDGDNYHIELIEAYPSQSKAQLLFRERYFIESLICINKNIPIRTDEETIQIKKDKDIVKASKFYNQLYADNEEIINLVNEIKPDMKTSYIEVYQNLNVAKAKAYYEAMKADCHICHKPIYYKYLNHHILNIHS